MRSELEFVESGAGELESYSQAKALIGERLGTHYVDMVLRVERYIVSSNGLPNGSFAVGPAFDLVTKQSDVDEAHQALPVTEFTLQQIYLQRVYKTSAFRVIYQLVPMPNGHHMVVFCELWVKLPSGRWIAPASAAHVSAD